MQVETGGRMISNMQFPQCTIFRMREDLAILFPHWMRHTKKLNPARYARLAVNVFGVDPEGKSDEEIANEGIEKLRAYWTCYRCT